MPKTKSELENETLKLTSINQALLRKAAEDAKTMQRLHGDIAMICQINNVLLVSDDLQQEINELRESNLQKDKQLSKLRQAKARKDAEIARLRHAYNSSNVSHLIECFGDLNLALAATSRRVPGFSAMYPELAKYAELSIKYSDIMTASSVQPDEKLDVSFDDISTDFEEESGSKADNKTSDRHRKKMRCA